MCRYRCDSRACDVRGLPTDERSPVTPPPHTAGTAGRGLRIGLVLILVSLVPLVGTAVMTVGTIRGAQADAAAASRTELLARRTVSLTKLDGAVFDEMVWTAIDRVATSIGAPPGVITAFLGSDPATQVDAARERTDALLSEAAMTDIVGEVASARSTEIDRYEVIARYGVLTDRIKAQLSAGLSELAASPADSWTDELLRSVRTLQLAVDARGAVAEEYYAYFATMIDLRDAPADEVEHLIEARDIYDRSLTDLIELGADVPELAAALDGLSTDASLVAFRTAIDDLVSRSLTDGVPDRSPELTLDTVTANLDGFSAVYRAAAVSSQLTFDLLDATASAVLDASAQARAAADADIDRAYLLALALTTATLMSAAIAARYIVRPLRRLRHAAHNLRVGDTYPAQLVTGPNEVHAATLAIADAGAHLELATRQARALAMGDLDAAVLDEPAPGGLGAALEHAVQTLRSALSKHDEFRRRLAHETSHDGLTKLPNRTASLAQLSRSLARTTRSGSQLAVLFIDLDQFKAVNDRHGHQVGDVILQAVAQRLVTNAREGDHVGRLGSDEFVVIAEPVSGVDEAMGLAQRILATIAVAVPSHDTAISTTASIGIAVANGVDLTADELIRDADLAVDRAKCHGPGSIEICNEDLRNEVTRSASQFAAIRHAIDADELVMHYQPVVSAGSHEPAGLEALVRWQRPGCERPVPPIEFIEFAERSSLIVDIDRWVIAAVAKQIADWSRVGDVRPTPVAINISGRHLADDAFVDHVLVPLAAHGVNPSSITIEITESALLDDLATAAVKLQLLREAGVRVAIDDFGTGYTSIAHLRLLPVDILKIDRSITASALGEPSGGVDRPADHRFRSPAGSDGHGRGRRDR